jgi:capsular polysaccharide biosynthesis protein
LVDAYLFKNESVNAYDYKKKVLRMNKLFLLRNQFNDELFHSFPLYSRNVILNNINKNFNLIGTKLYVSRGKALHLPRNLDNEPEILDYAIENGYKEINPENVSLDEFVCNVNAANKIIITWGSALTNLVYCKENTQVIILKSKSYDSENIQLFMKIINTYKINIRIISHENNKINIPFL